MKRTIFVLSTVLVMAVMINSAAFAAGETVFSGNLRLHYNKLYDDANDEWKEDSFGLHYVELWVKKDIGCCSVFVNERIGDGNANYLYEGWVSYKAPADLGNIKIGLVPVPFGIFKNGLYYPKGILYAKNWMWEYDYGASYDVMKKLSDILGVSVAAAYLSRESSAGELGAFSAGDCPVCTGERDTISGRIGVDVDMAGALGLKAGGSVQLGKLQREDAEDDDKLGIAGDVSITPKMIPIPITLMGEFVNYSLGETDAMKGNILMGQADITLVKSMGMLDAAILSLHYGMDTSNDEDIPSTSNLIGQLHLITCKQLHIFAQVFGDKIEDVDDMRNKGLRVWFMYVF